MTTDVEARTEAAVLVTEWETRYAQEWEDSEFHYLTARTYAGVVAQVRVGIRKTTSFSKGARFSANLDKDRAARLRVREQIDTIRSESDHGGS